MTDSSAIDPSFPIGKVQYPDAPDLAAYSTALQDSARELEALVTGLGAAQLELTYRPGSFTARQLIHHIADSHELGFMRFRWGLTEQAPTVLPMNQDAWAALADYALPPAVSLPLHLAVNARWVAVLGDTDPDAMQRGIVHPQEGRMTLWRLLAKHEWHVRHHTAQLRLALGAFPSSA